MASEPVDVLAALRAQGVTVTETVYTGVCCVPGCAVDSEVLGGDGEEWCFPHEPPREVIDG